jgi:Fe-S-cluster containining protein
MTSSRANEDALLAELAAVYRDADALFATHRCPATAECCHFELLGREPYVTSIELAAIARAVAARGGPLAPKRRSLPLVGDAPERICPLLDREGRCSVYRARPLGCRSYWCQRAESARAVDRTEVAALVGRIQDIAARHAADGDRGRPLCRALASAPSPCPGPLTRARRR